MLNLETLQTLVGNAPQGVSETAIPNVQVFWSREAMPKHTQAYAFGLAFILQGHKIGYLGARRFHYGAGQYLAVGLPLHFECETHLQNQSPLLGIFVQLDRSELSSLFAEMMAHKALPSTIGERSGVEPLPIHAPIRWAVCARTVLPRAARCQQRGASRSSQSHQPRKPRRPNAGLYQPKPTPQPPRGGARPARPHEHRQF